MTDEEKFDAEVAALLDLSVADLGVRLAQEPPVSPDVLRAALVTESAGKNRVTALDALSAAIEALAPQSETENKSTALPIFDEDGDLVTQERWDALYNEHEEWRIELQHFETQRELDANSAAIERTLLVLPEKDPEIFEGPFGVVFSEDDGLLDSIEPIGLGAGDLEGRGGQFVVASKISIGGNVDPARITHAWLTAAGVPVRRCEIPNGLAVGGGRGAEFAAGSLAF